MDKLISIDYLFPSSRDLRCASILGLIFFTTFRMAIILNRPFDCAQGDGCVYSLLMAGRKKEELYVGMAKNLKWRISEHKNELRDGFTERNKIKKLVYYEQCGGKESAVLREKQLKKWNKLWKIRLIEKFNPE